ncbi:MAG: hypothetical protein QOI63_1422, partial [Thermoplasmata archaeon]|nr:hypothetical protein [Thermoplasmata archaeon]
FFSPEGSGGSFDSNINVNFDVRAGSIDGPILASASLVLGATGTPWQHLPDAPGVLRCMTHPEFATNADVLARHGICGPPVLVPHVNDKLNGFDASNDFHPGTVGLVATPAGEITIHNIPDAAHPLGQPTVLAVPAGWGCIDTATSAAIFAGYHFTGNPAVRCDGPAGTTNLCLATGSVGYGATSGFMRIVSACGALPNADTGAFTATGHASSVGAGLFAWTCDITVPVGPAFIDWWAHCSVNRPA